MAWFEDLSYIDYFGVKFSKMLCGENHSKMLKAVGWLESGKPYSTGEIPEGVVEKLWEFRAAKEFRTAMLGIHQCDFCGSKFIDQFGSITSFVAFKNKVYVFPDLIIHYINLHSYLPPAEFIEAVLVSTPRETLEFFKKIRENKFK